MNSLRSSYLLPDRIDYYIHEQNEVRGILGIALAILGLALLSTMLDIRRDGYLFIHALPFTSSSLLQKFLCSNIQNILPFQTPEPV